MSQTPDESQQPGYAGDVDPQQAWEMLESDPDTVIVDCRTEAEWSFVGVPDVSGLGRQVTFVPWNHFPSGHNERFVDDLRAAGIGPGQPVVFLCRSGQRSIGAAVAATEAGLGPAYNIAEGFEGAVGPEGHRDVEGWKVRGLPWRQG
jgi:rhodanese-related sulfurtransferase